MSYKLTCTSAKDYVHIRVDGTWPSERPEDIIVGIYNLWANHRERGLLIDIRHMEGTPSVFGDFKEAELFDEAGFRLIRRIAVLDDLNRKEANDFFETTTVNRELHFRFFYADEQDAIKWILSEEQDQT